MKSNPISTKKIAEICGVSQGTVDRALNDRKGIRPETKEKILAVAKEYGYRPNIHARCIAGGKSQLIGVVIFDLNNQYFSDILTSIETYCTAQGYSTVVMFTDKNAQKEIECIQTLYAMSVDGIILCPINCGEAFENFLLSLSIPLVTFGNRLNTFPYVGIDNTSAMTETVEYVLDKGYQRLIYVKPALKEKNTFAQTQRLQAFVQVCDAAGAEYVITDPANAEQEADPGKKNAFVCPTDLYAIRLLSAARRLQAGIIGFDNIRLIDALDLGLDSVAYDVETAAKAAADCILSGKQPQQIRHSIIRRGSI